MNPIPAVAGGAYHPDLAALRRRRVSGVYVIIDRASDRVLYVGESHSGRLYDTLTRHFRAWERSDVGGARRGGTMYDRRRVLVAWQPTPADQAQAVQYDWIERLAPRDNTLTGAQTIAIPI